MNPSEIEYTKEAWATMPNVFHIPRNEVEYEQLISFLDSLTDEVGEVESHPLASLMEVIGLLIKQYEDDHISEL